VFSAHLIGAAWTPYSDPRAVVLAATYRLLHDITGQAHIGQRNQPCPDGQIASGQHQ
jgi:hypothetical protein